MNSNLLVSILISKETLTSIDKDQLIDMLQHKTQLLLTARTAKLIDKEYTQLLRKEVENIQAEIKRRMS